MVLRVTLTKEVALPKYVKFMKRKNLVRSRLGAEAAQLEAAETTKARSRKQEGVTH